MEIKGLRPDVLEEMLSFIYCGKTPNLDKLAGDLLEAANRYQVEPLKAICEEKLCKLLDVENCVTFVTLGDLYHANNLRRAALNFIACNRKSVKMSKNWKYGFNKMSPDLMLEVFEACK